MKLVSVWCEYDINGDFGGDSNEAVFYVEEILTTKEVESLIEKNLSSITNLDGEDLEDLWDWDYIEPLVLEG